MTFICHYMPSTITILTKLMFKSSYNNTYLLNTLSTSADIPGIARTSNAITLKRGHIAFRSNHHNLTSLISGSGGVEIYESNSSWFLLCAEICRFVHDPRTKLLSLELKGLNFQIRSDMTPDLIWSDDNFITQLGNFDDDLLTLLCISMPTTLCNPTK